MKLSKQQQSIIAHEASALVVGAAGTGKTTCLAARVAYLLKQGIDPEGIYVAVFSLRSLRYLQSLLARQVGESAATKIKVGTFRDFALEAIEAAEAPLPNIASYVEIRRLLGSAMREANFKGSIGEAEHIIRQFKARARRPQENERHYNLLIAFKNLMEQSDIIDRYDLLRQHIVGMANGSFKPCPMKYLLVDNIQDATEIQLYWLFEHLKDGAHITAFGDDDQCVFSVDGAVGEAAFEMLKDTFEEEPISQLFLKESFRQPEGLGVTSLKIVDKLTNRLPKKTKFVSSSKVDVRTKLFDNIQDEYKWLRHNVANMVQKYPKCKIGILTRTEHQALRVSHIFEQSAVPHTCLATGVWDTPGAIMALDMLSVLLNTANDDQLRNILIGVGLNLVLVDNLFANGMIAKDWLAKGAHLPSGIDLPASTLQEYSILQRRLVGYYQVMQERILSPREVFKASAHDLLQQMSSDDRRDGLMAVEKLCNLKGQLKELLPKIRERKPLDMKQTVFVSPIREIRNQEFDFVFMPMSNSNVYPFTGMKTLGMDEDHEKRMFYLAVTRAKRGIVFTHSGQKSKYVDNIAAALQQ